MKLAFTTNILSPHQLPLARLMAERVGPENYRYIYTQPLPPDRLALGWARAQGPWCIPAESTEGRRWAESVPVLYAGWRDPALFLRRLRQGKPTLYLSERWLKRPFGLLRLLSPRFLVMTLRLASCFRRAGFLYLPIGVHAARDMLRLLGLLRGDVRCLWRAPKVAFEARPGGAIVPLAEAARAGVLSPEALRFARRYGFAQVPQCAWGRLQPRGRYARLRLWGYFVEGEAPAGEALSAAGARCGVLWAGRLLRLKRVETILRACRAGAVKGGEALDLALYGAGPDEWRVRRLAARLPGVQVGPLLAPEALRAQMHRRACYVLASDNREGWGVVVNEALEAGMRVIATVDSGAGATLLPPEALFRAGDWRTLARRLRAPVGGGSAAAWRPACAWAAFEKMAAQLAAEVQAGKAPAEGEKGPGKVLQKKV